MERKLVSTDFVDSLASTVSSRGRPLGKPLTVQGKALREYDSIQQWLDLSELKPTQSYRKNSLKYMAEFCQFLEADPDTLLADRKARLKAEPDDRTDENHLNSWYHKLGQRHAVGFALTKYTAVVSFFKWNNKPLNIARFPRVAPEDRREFKRLRKEEIQKLLGFAARYRGKNMLLIGAESGLRLHHLLMLRLRHLVIREDGSREGIPAQNWRDLADAEAPVRIQLPKRCYFGKKKAGICFLCGDGVKSIVQDLKARESKGEPIGPESPLLPVYPATVRFSATGHLSRNSFFGEWHAKGSQAMVREPGPHSRNSKLCEGTVQEIRAECATVSTLEYDMRILRERAGLIHNAEEERAASIHSLRKYLRSTLDASGVNAVVASVIVGHSNAVEEHYSGAKHLDIGEIRAAYASVMGRISITEDTRPIIEKTQRRVSELESYAKGLEQKLSEYGSVKDQLAELQRQVRDILTDRANTKL